MTDTLKRVAETLAAHGQREAAAEVADISLSIKTASIKAASKSEPFANLLKKGGMKVKYNAKTDSGTATSSGLTIGFSPSTNDPGVWVEVAVDKFKAESNDAADVVLDMVKALRKI